MIKNTDTERKNYIVEHHRIKNLQNNYYSIGNKNANQQKLEPKKSLKINLNGPKKTEWLKKQIRNHKISNMKETRNIK